MFCPKCGTKAIEGAAFCQKCGARLIKDDEPAQNPSEAAAVTPQELEKKASTEPPPVKQPTADRPTVEHPSTKRLSDAAQETSAPTTAPTSGNGADVYVLLKENIAKCPSIKAAKQAKNGVYLQGKIHNHFVTIASGQAGIGCSLAFPLSILYYLFGGSLAAIAVNIGWNAVDYGFYWESFYTVLLVVGLLSLGSALITSKFCGIQEKADVEAYVREILDSQGVILTTRAKKQSYSKAPQDSSVKKSSWKLPAILGVVVLVVVLVLLGFRVFGDKEPSVDTPSDPSESAVNVGASDSPAEPSNAPAEDGEAFSSEVQMAYAEKVQELAAENGDLQFALLDLTAKEIPELVAEYHGYGVMVFFYADGEVLGGDPWPYGAGGNLGYEYLPGENVILNYNNDYAGTIQYESYFALGPAGEPSPLPGDQLSIRHFRDANGNGYPDEDEPFQEEPIYYVGDSEVSKDVYASHQITGEFEWLGGDKSTEEMLALLGVGYEPAYPQGAAVELYHNGVALSSLLGCAPVDLYNTLGAPMSGTPVTGEMDEGGEYYGYQGISFHIDFATNTVRWITAMPGAIDVNGTPLEQTRSGLIELLGNPESEGNYHDELDDTDVYEMRYAFTGFELLIRMADINSIPYYILISSI